MKLALVLAAVLASFTAVPPPALAAALHSQSGLAQAANVLRYDNVANPDGSYSYAVEIDNGIAAQAQGTPRDFGGNPPVVPVVSQGSFSWISPEGQHIVITYIADENGYQPSGDAIPTVPPPPGGLANSLGTAKLQQQRKN